MSRRARWLRRLSRALVVSLAVAAVVATAILINDLIRGEQVTDEAAAPRLRAR